MHSCRNAAVALMAALLAQPAGAQEQQLRPPPVSPSQLRSYAYALLDTASYLEQVKGARVQCEGGITWQGRVVPISTKMHETCPPWREGDSAWSRALTWVIEASGTTPSSACGDSGPAPSMWSGYCTTCPIPYDTTIDVIRGDALALQKMASIIECMQDGVRARQNERRKQEEAAAAKQREEERRAQEEERKAEEERRRQEAAERQRAEQQRRAEEAEREREARERRDREMREKVARIEERHEREREAVNDHFRMAEAQAATLGEAEVGPGIRKGEFWITADLDVMSSADWYVVGYGITLGFRKSFFHDCDDENGHVCKGWEARARYDTASGSSTDEITGAYYEASRNRFELEGAHWWGKFAAAGHYEKGSFNDASLTRVGAGVMVSATHDKSDMMEAAAFLFPSGGGGLIRGTMGVNMFFLGLEYSWMPEDGATPSDNVFKAMTGMRIPW